MTCRYVVGGVAFTTDVRLDELDTDGFSDAEVRVRFANEALMRSIDQTGGKRVDGPVGTSGVIAAGTRECWLPDPGEGPGHRAWLLRQMAPIFSAALGRIVLHAGAVEVGGGIVGFIGESGAGKSTLAYFLADHGHAFVTDDLLPVRFVPEAVSPAGGRMLPLSTLVLLSRSDVPEIRSVRLEALRALQCLVDNGFGEHGDPEIWALQFDAYHRLVEMIPVYAFVIPDDVGALPKVRDAILGLASEV